MITRTTENGHLDQIPGVGEHAPMWESFDCPSCGSAPCGPHPPGLVCTGCEDDWPCSVAVTVAAELDRLVEQIDASSSGCHREDADLLHDRATELRGRR